MKCRLIGHSHYHWVRLSKQENVTRVYVVHEVPDSVRGHGDLPKMFLRSH